MHLHRRGREQHERPALGSELLHQAKELVRSAFLRRARRFPAGVVGLVQDEQVPVLGLEQIGRPVAPTHEMAGGEDKRLLVPLLPVNLAFGGPCHPWVSLPDKLLAVVDRDVEVELLVELALPLGQQRPRHEDQNSLGSSRQPRLTDEQAGRDGLAQADLVGNEHLAGPGFDAAVVRPHLVGPGVTVDVTSPTRDAVPGPGCVADVGPDHPRASSGSSRCGGGDLRVGSGVRASCLRRLGGVMNRSSVGRNSRSWALAASGKSRTLTLQA